MAILNSSATHVLLGHNRRWPTNFFSTLAGFCEPCESVEDAVRREVWEESGVTVGRVIIHSTQPWPYPASLMIGAIGQALPGEGERINVGHDPELEEARWVELGELRRLVEGRQSGLEDEAPEGHRGIRIPPPTAIAHQLIKACVLGWHKGGEQAKI